MYIFVKQFNAMFNLIVKKSGDKSQTRTKMKIPVLSTKTIVINWDNDYEAGDDFIQSCSLAWIL